MRTGPRTSHGGRPEQANAAGPGGRPSGPGPDLRLLLPRRDLRVGRAPTREAFRAVLSGAKRDLAGLLRDVHERAAPGAGGPPGRPIDDLLARAVRCAVQQYTLQAELGALALADELTGLCNRRGFLMLAERQLKLGRRAGRSMLFFFIDVDGLKAINDSFGHGEGDVALVRTAEALERTFRDSDILARFGGDEFAALAVEAAGDGEEVITARLRANLRAVTPRDCRYALTVSTGVARFDPARRTPIGRLMALADQAMYENKRRGRPPWEHPGNPRAS